MSKAVIYALALEDHGHEKVLKHIGVEPSGEAFNSITFDERNNRPFNPMVNSGAIAATALIRGDSHAERYRRILDIFRRFTGRERELDEAVYRSESLTANRNRAIAYLEAQRRHDRGQCRGASRSLFPPVLAARLGPRPGADRRDASPMVGSTR